MAPLQLAQAKSSSVAASALVAWCSGSFLAMAQLALRHRLMPRRSWIRGGRKRKVAKMASWRLGTWLVKAAAERLQARRLLLHLLLLHLDLHLGLHLG